jgi:hypothetical protein
MRRDNVYNLIGIPESTNSRWNGNGTTEYYCGSKFNIGYDNDGLVEHLGFIPGSVELTIDSRTIWKPGEHVDPNILLLKLDPEPLEYVGFWFFVRLGVATAGFHDDDAAESAVAVFPRGTKDDLLAEAKPAVTEIYRRPS